SLRQASSRMPPGAGAPNLLASFAGKNRILVITAPSESDGYYRLMMSLLKPDVYCELAERHVNQIVMFHQEGEMGAKVRRITTEGKVVEEPLDSALIPRLMSFLKMEQGKFGMVLLKKTLQVEERYPYPVRLEAMYEVIDQSPMRKLEKRRQKGFVQKCKEAGVEGQVEKATHTDAALNTLGVYVLFHSFQHIHCILRAVFCKMTTQRATRSQTAAPRATAPPNTNQRVRERYPNKSTPAANDPKDEDAKAPHGAAPVPATRKPPRTKSQRRKNEGKKFSLVHLFLVELSQRENYFLQSKHTFDPWKKIEQAVANEDEEKHKPIKPNASDTEETETVTVATRVKTVRKKDKTTKKTDKVTKKADNRGGKTAKDVKMSEKKIGKKSFPYPKKAEASKPTKKPAAPARGSLPSFLDHFENKRRLLLITSPSEEHKMYVQQRDEFLESVCDMAIRKISIITIFGSLTNSTMKIDHYQLENDKLMKGIHQEDTVNQDLITELRKEFGMVHDDFYMVLTDTDMKTKQSYEVPISMKAIFDYIDTFSSRIREMEQQKRDGVLCKKEDKPRSLENFLSRFRWRRRLLIISSPSDEEWSFQQQLYSLNSQACNLGLRHIAVLKLVGTELLQMGGVLELYPINGSTTVDREGLSGTLVKDMRNYFQISPEYFSMLLVGKDGNVKSWYPSPMWSMATIYDLVDSMQLRRQEMAIQQSLGMRCPEFDYGYHQHGYEHGYQDGYHQGYGY
uniref:Coiled-coil domain-containing protein 80 n=1 Tax=Tetraodon nigroviridis TaxID=99883 RepID=H3D1X6_TETNG